MLVKLGQVFLGGIVLGEFVYATGKSCGVFGPFNVSPIDPPAAKNIANVSLPRVVILEAT